MLRSIMLMDKTDSCLIYLEKDAAMGRVIANAAGKGLKYVGNKIKNNKVTSAFIGSTALSGYATGKEEGYVEAANKYASTMDIIEKRAGIISRVFSRGAKLPPLNKNLPVPIKQSLPAKIPNTKLPGTTTIDDPRNKNKYWEFTKRSLKWALPFTVVDHVASSLGKQQGYNDFNRDLSTNFNSPYNQHTQYKAASLEKDAWLGAAAKAGINIAKKWTKNTAFPWLTKTTKTLAGDALIWGATDATVGTAIDQIMKPSMPKPSLLQPNRSRVGSTVSKNMYKPPMPNLYSSRPPKPPSPPKPPKFPEQNKFN